MNIYKINQTENNGYDTYDSAVVCAENVEEAKQISPEGEWRTSFSSWCNSPEQVKVELIGIASENIEKGVIVASFNAG